MWVMYFLSLERARNPQYLYADFVPDAIPKALRELYHLTLFTPYKAGTVRILILQLWILAQRG